MPLRPRLLACAACVVTLSALPARAEEGFLDRLFGGTTGAAAPANPFASNYPSAAPSQREVAAARAERAARRSRGGEGGPIPPGRIPEE